MGVLSNAIRMGASQPAAAEEDDAYQIEKSLRLTFGEQSYLNRTFTASDSRTWTFNCWYKSTADTNANAIFGTRVGAANDTTFCIRIETDYTIKFGTENETIRQTSQVFRDPGAWMMLTFVLDTPNEIPDDRFRLYVNGVRITAWGTKSTITQNREFGWNKAGEMNIGRMSSLGYYADQLMADVHFIDGMALNPSAFGSYDSTGAWNPKAFSLPAPNNGSTWSSGVTSSTGGFDSGYPATALFNDNYSNDPGSGAEPGANTGNIIWTVGGSGLAFNDEVAIMSASNIPFRLTLASGEVITKTNPSSTGASPSILILYSGSGTITKIESVNNGSNWTNWRGIRVDGRWLVDGTTDATVRNNLNAGTVWSNTLTSWKDGSSHTFNSGNEATFAFDGLVVHGTNSNWANQTLSTGSGQLLQLKWVPPSTITKPKTLRMFVYTGESGDEVYFRFNGETRNNAHTAYANYGHYSRAAWVNVSTYLPDADITEIIVERTAQASGRGSPIGAIEIDGQVLQDSHPDNSFQLKFNDVSSNAALGTDSLESNNWTVNNIDENNGEVTVAAAAGLSSDLKPFYVTSGDQGGTKGVGYNTDSSAGTTDGTGLVFALPGDVLTDEHDHVNTGSSANSLTNSGSVAVSTDHSRHYGSSLRFTGSNYLEGSDSNDFQFGTGNFTVEFWCRLTSYPAGVGGVFDTESTGSINANRFSLPIYSNGILKIDNNSNLLTAATALPLNEWTHVAVVRSGTGANETKFYFNGVLNVQGTVGTNFSNNGLLVGKTFDGGHFKGYINDLRVYKGVAKYSGNFVVPAFAVNSDIDSLVDSPTSYGTDGGLGGQVRSNYCTWNQLDKYGTTTLTDGALKAVTTTNSQINGTFMMPSGKWYFEWTCKTASVMQIGIVDTEGEKSAAPPGGASKNGIIYLTTTAAGDTNTGKLYNNAVEITTGWPSCTIGSVVMVAYDADTGKLWFGKDGTWFNTGGSTGNPATGAHPAITVSADYRAQMTPVCGAGGGSDAANGYGNFGQRAFKHAAPSGFKCLCTANLPDTFSGGNLNNPSKFFDVLTYTGAGGTTTISGLNFQPDMVWSKCRNEATSHIIYDAVRGAGADKGLNTDQTREEGSSYDGSSGTTFGYISAFTSNGYTVVDGNQTTGYVNKVDDTYVSWNWDAGSSVTPSSSYNITPSAQYVNADAGFSITAYTGNASTDQTIPHGLATAPDLIITRSRSHAIDWPYHHSSGTANKDFFLNLTNVENTVVGGADNVTHGGHQSVNNNTWTTAVGQTTDDNVNKSGETYISYAWTSIPGYSKFGGYKGTGADRLFINLGFRPKFVAIKSRDVGESTMLFDAERDPYNEVDERFLASHNLVANQDQDLGDFLSNGFSLYSNWPALNQSGKLYTYWAWAEHPFKTSRAR